MRIKVNEITSSDVDGQKVLIQFADGLFTAYSDDGEALASCTDSNALAKHCWARGAGLVTHVGHPFAYGHDKGQ